MAGDEDQKPKVPSIPSWQQASTDPSADHTGNDATSSTSKTELDPIEQARLFLQHDDIKDAPRDRKVEFLEKKGLQADDIQKLLVQDEDTPPDVPQDGLKTIHDSNTTIPEPATTSSPVELPSISSNTPPIDGPGVATVVPKSEAPPIITYPEFLLKPQKPPPLVTIDRLATASYVLAGISALTWGASKYLVAPMLESLTSSRHDLASTTLTSLTTLNDKLESSVSHVPYIPLLHQQKSPDDGLSDTSSDSDPTELFHRDYGTQTSPPKSRSSSQSSTTSPLSTTTATQTARITSLHSSLSSLLSSTSTSFSTDSLSTSITDLQSIIDRIESNSQPLYTTYDYKATSGFTNPNPSSTSSSTKGKADKDNQSEAAKFKAEIRALKGAFLSSRNFPTAPRPPTMGAGSTPSYGTGTAR